MSIQGNKISLNSSGIVRSINDTEVAKKHPYLCVKQGGSGNSKFVEIKVYTDYNDTDLNNIDNKLFNVNGMTDINNTYTIKNTFDSLYNYINNEFQFTQDFNPSKDYLIRMSVKTFNILETLSNDFSSQYINTCAEYLNSSICHTDPVGTLVNGGQTIVLGSSSVQSLFVPTFAFDKGQLNTVIATGNNIMNIIKFYLIEYIDRYNLSQYVGSSISLYITIRITEI